MAARASVREHACMSSVKDLRPNPRWGQLKLTETLLPADGNPNHLHLTVTRASPYTLDFGGDGDVTNPDLEANLLHRLHGLVDLRFGVVSFARQRLKTADTSGRCPLLAQSGHTG